MLKPRRDLAIHHALAAVTQITIFLHLRQIAPAAPTFMIVGFNHEQFLPRMNCRHDEQLGKLVG